MRIEMKVIGLWYQYSLFILLVCQDYLFILETKIVYEKCGKSLHLFSTLEPEGREKKNSKTFQAESLIDWTISKPFLMSEI